MESILIEVRHFSNISANGKKQEVRHFGSIGSQPWTIAMCDIEVAFLFCNIFIYIIEDNSWFVLAHYPAPNRPTEATKAIAHKDGRVGEKGRKK